MAPLRFRIPAAVSPDNVMDRRARSPDQGLDRTQSLMEQQSVANTPHTTKLASRGNRDNTEENWKSVLSEDEVVG